MKGLRVFMALFLFNTLVSVSAATRLLDSQMVTSLYDALNGRSLPQPIQPSMDDISNGLCCWDHLPDAVVTDWKPYDMKPHRIRCDYCGVVSEKDYGTCEHCGAPLPL